MTKATLYAPTKVSTCKYKWDLLEVKKSTQPSAGNGVFAKQDIHVGAMFPIVGKPIDITDTPSHGWHYCGKNKGTAVDGNPDLNPYNNTGNYGLSIAMMVNEHLTNKPNCKFKLDCLVVATPIKKGSELFIDYGRAYEPTRQQHGYTYTNKFQDAAYPAYDKLKYPSAAKRHNAITKLNNIISGCATPLSTQPPKPLKKRVGFTTRWLPPQKNGYILQEVLMTYNTAGSTTNYHYTEAWVVTKGKITPTNDDSLISPTDSLDTPGSLIMNLTAWFLPKHASLKEMGLAKNTVESAGILASARGSINAKYKKGPYFKRRFTATWTGDGSKPTPKLEET